MQDVNTPWAEVMFHGNDNVDKILFFVETCTGRYEEDQ
jgi:hypothetical protein